MSIQRKTNYIKELKRLQIALGLSIIGFSCSLFVVPFSFPFILIALFTGIVWSIFAYWYDKSKSLNVLCLYMLVIIVSTVVVGDDLAVLFFEDEFIFMARFQFISVAFTSLYLFLILYKTISKNHQNKKEDIRK